METTRREQNGHKRPSVLEKRGEICPTCAQEIPAFAPMGACPSCLFEIGIEARRGAFDDTFDDPSGLSDTVPRERRVPPGPASGGPLFGGFELGKLLGSSMGEVYEARDLRMGRDVALKKLPGGARPSAFALRLFHDEIKSFATLDHPNIVPVYEAGEHQGQHYFTMKLLPSDLKQQLWRFEGDPAGAAELVEKIALAVHHLHQRGILHRDLKPANILLDHANPPHPYVADFGVAKHIGGDGQIHKTGVVVGTLPYMAPEQAAGKSVTWAADIYSLGVILYELLVRKQPFQGKDDSEIARAKQRPPKDPREIDPRVEPDLARICLRCLDKDAENRYDSAEALARALRRYLNGESFEGASRAERAWRWSLRHPVTAGLVLAVLSFLVLVTSRAVSLVGQQEAAKQAQIRQVNMSSAAMVAGTVLSQMRTLSDVVERAASDEELVDALEDNDQDREEAFCEATYAYYEDPDHGLKPNGSSPFNMWFVLGMDGQIKARFGRLGKGGTVGKWFTWRDYFQGASRLARKGLRSTYISRPHRSESDGIYQFTISSPIYRRDGAPAGILVAGVASKANLGSLALDDTESIVVLVAPRDRERNDPRPESPYLILRHPAYAYGEAIGMDDEQVRKVGELDLDPERRVERKLWLPDPGRVTSISGYQDPVAKTHPDYAGSWLAGFAPVGNTGFVVIVQTREDEAMKPELTLARQLVKWTLLSAAPGVLLVLFAAVYSRWRGRKRTA